MLSENEPCVRNTMPDCSNLEKYTGVALHLRRLVEHVLLRERAVLLLQQEQEPSG